MVLIWREVFHNVLLLKRLLFYPGSWQQNNTLDLFAELVAGFIFSVFFYPLALSLCLFW